MAALVLLLEVEAAVLVDLALERELAVLVAALAFELVARYLELIEDHRVLLALLLVVALPDAALALLLVERRIRRVEARVRREGLLDLGDLLIDRLLIHWLLKGGLLDVHLGLHEGLHVLGRPVDDLRGR